jgi:hypothetical protein
MSFRLTFIQDSMVNEQEYIELGLSCADICKALGRGMNGKKLGDLSQSVGEAINQLTTCVKQVVDSPENSLTTKLIAGLWRIFKGRSSDRADGTRYLDSSMRRTLRTRLPPGR